MSGNMGKILSETELVNRDGKLYLRFPPWSLALLVVIIALGVTTNAITLRSISTVVDRHDVDLQRLSRESLETRLILKYAHPNAASQAERDLEHIP